MEAQLSDIEELFEGERNFVANASNLASYIYNTMEDLNWAGFYIFDGKELVLGPFQGKPACIRIGIGKGVCGTAAEKGETVIVENVHEFEGHIACDSASNSEIVVPLKFNGKIFGVMDIDSPKYARFGMEDKLKLEEYAEKLISKSDVGKMLDYYAAKLE